MNGQGRRPAPNMDMRPGGPTGPHSRMNVQKPKNMKKAIGRLLRYIGASKYLLVLLVIVEHHLGLDAVMSNKLIRPMLTKGAGWRTYFSEPTFSADNAAGTAILCALASRS